MRKKNKKFIYLMLLPATVNFLIFWVLVNYNSIVLGFQTSIGGNVRYGLDNFFIFFREVTKPDSIIFQALKNTLLFFANGVIIILPLSILVSYFLYKKIFMYKYFRVVLFLPSIISAIVLTTLFKYIISPTGPISMLYEKYFHESLPIFLSDSKYAVWAIIIFCIWTGFGVNIVLFQGAMTRIPTEMLESARIDGVGMAKELFYIILPLIWPTISTMILFSFVGLFTASGPILLLTKGTYSTYTISFWIFDEVTARGSFEYSSAVGLIFTLIGLPIVLTVKKLLSKVLEDVQY